MASTTSNMKILAAAAFALLLPAVYLSSAWAQTANPNAGLQPSPEYLQKLSSAQEDFDAGVKAFQLKDYQKAEELFAKAAKTFPGFDNNEDKRQACHHYIGHCQYHLKSGDLGLAELERSKPNRASPKTSAQMKLGVAAQIDINEILFQQKKYAEAVSGYLTYMAEDLNDAEIVLCSLETNHIGDPNQMCEHAMIAALEGVKDKKENYKNNLFYVVSNMDERGLLAHQNLLLPVLQKLEKYGDEFVAESNTVMGAWSCRCELRWAKKLKSGGAEYMQRATERFAKVDAQISRAIHRLIDSDRRISPESQDLSIVCNHGNVTLSGTINYAKDAAAIHSKAENFPGVQSVHDMMKNRNSNGSTSAPGGTSFYHSGNEMAID